MANYEETMINEQDFLPNADQLIKQIKPTRFLGAVKAVLRMTMPIFCSSVLNTLKRFFGMLMIAYLGAVALAAGALITTSQTALLKVAMFWSSFNLPFTMLSADLWSF